MNIFDKLYGGDVKPKPTRTVGSIFNFPTVEEENQAKMKLASENEAMQKLFSNKVAEGSEKIYNESGGLRNVADMNEDEIKAHFGEMPADKPFSSGIPDAESRMRSQGVDPIYKDMTIDEFARFAEAKKDLAPPSAKGKVFGYTYNSKGEFFENGRKMSPQEISAMPPNAQPIHIKDDGIKIGNQEIQPFFRDPSNYEEALYKTGDEFLETLKPQYKKEVQAIARGQLTPTNAMSARYGGSGNLFALASAYAGEPVDENFIKKRLAMQKDFSSGATSKNIKSIGTAIAHLDTLVTLGKELDNSPIPAWNAIANWYLKQTGNPLPQSFEAARAALSAEVASVYKGGSAAPTDPEIDAQLKLMSTSASPKQLAGYAKTTMDLMAGRLASIKDQWRNGMGDAPFTFVTERHKNILKKHGIGRELTEDSDSIDSMIDAAAKKE